MSDAVADSRIVEWIRDLFANGNATSESMIKWMLVAWLVATIVLVGLDRLSASLLGRSKPLAQEPPRLARSWRWRRGLTPPATYSMLPSGTMVTPATTPVPESIPLAFDPADVVPEILSPLLLLDRPDVADEQFWTDLASETHPLFGLENNERLDRGEPPERFNPVIGRVQRIERDIKLGSVKWPNSGDEIELTINFGDKLETDGAISE